MSASALSPRERATLEAVSRALIPAGGPIEGGALEMQVPDHIARMATDMDPLSRQVVGALLHVLEVSPIFRGPGRRLTHLTPAEAESFMSAAISHGRARPTAAWLLRLLVEANYTSSPPVMEALGIRREPLYSEPPVPPPRAPLPSVRYPALAVGSTLEVDACVIGSGAGGAPAAARLAEAGWKVAILEEGPVVSRTDFTGSAIEMISRYYRGNGIFFTMGSPMVQISHASSVGGTTVFNSGTCLVPAPSTLEGWSRRCRLPGVTADALATTFSRVQEFLQVALPRADILGENAAVLKRGAEAFGQGLRHGVIPRPAPGCRGSDECVVGCPTDAKRSMALSYLPRAVAAGAMIHDRVRVVDIRPGAGRYRWKVRANLLEPTSPNPVGPITVSCRHVVVAGGALATPYLLPGVGDRRARRHRGRHLHVHPSLDVAGDFEEPIRGWRGVLQSYYVEDSARGVLLEATFQPRGMLSTSGLVPHTGARYKSFLERIPHLALIGALILDESEGRLLPWMAGRPWVSYTLNDNDMRKVGRAISLSGQLLLAAGAKRVFVPVHGGLEVGRPEDLVRWETDPPSRQALHLLAFHPLGTARMAGDPDLGALDPSGTVWGAPGLHVSDASMLPGSPGVNPQISIIALAEQNAEAWIKAGVEA